MGGSRSVSGGGGGVSRSCRQFSPSPDPPVTASPRRTLPWCALGGTYMVSLGGRAAGRQTGYDGERSAADLRWRTVRQSSDVRSAEKGATKHCSHWIGGKTRGGG